MLNNISKGLVRGVRAYRSVAPSPLAVLKIPWLLPILTAKAAIQTVLRPGEASEKIGSFLGHLTFQALSARPSFYVKKGHLVAAHKNWKLWGLGASRRQWIGPEDQGTDSRIIKPLTVIYHDASEAGKHLDIHLGHLSVIYRVSNKPVEKKIKYNNKGLLTEESKEALLKHLRKEINNNSRTPWNHDHTVSNSQASWPYQEEVGQGYGSGHTRQVVLKDKVEFFYPDKSLHLYAPSINADQGLYLYPIYEGKTPILICGNLSVKDVAFKDRLHLKMVQEADYKKFLEKVDPLTVTRKEDGASAYFNIKEGERATLFSPRKSIVTGHRIEYSFKVPELLVKGPPSTGMGELLFWKKTLLGHLLPLKIEGLTWNYLSAAEIGGVLNSNQIRPRDIKPDFRTYRVDRFNGKNVHDLPFFKNRKLQQQIGNAFWRPVPLVIPRKNKSWEGLVGVPKGESINNGLKIKWKGDADDWKIESVDFFLSEKGHIAGVVRCTSLESGKHFKLGPGQIGDVDRCIDFMNHPKLWKGRVLKVASFGGTEGRAAKVVDVHLDK